MDHVAVSIEITKIDDCFQTFFFNFKSYFSNTLRLCVPRDRYSHKLKILSVLVKLPMVFNIYERCN